MHIDYWNIMITAHIFHERETRSTFKQYMYSNITSGKKIRIVVIILTVHCTDIYNKCLRLPDALADFSSGTPHKSF